MTCMKLINSVCIWKILMKGDESTNYKGLKLKLIFLVIFILFSLLILGVYLLFAKFPDNYPYKPPEIRFVTKVRQFY